MLGDMLLQSWRLGVTASRLGFRIQTEVIKGKTFHVTLKTESEVAFYVSHTVAMTAVKPVRGFEAPTFWSSSVPSLYIRIDQ